MKRKFHIGWVYEIEDKAPQSLRKKDAVLQLQDELKDFVKVENGKVRIVVCD